MTETIKAEAHRLRSTMAKMVRQAQDDNHNVIAAMPDKATTSGQRELQEKHGTPRAFAEACVNAIGAISPWEARVGIRKYRDEWEAAGALK